MVSNLKIAFRSLLRSPALAIACVASVALGIGAVSAVFAAIDTLILRPFPYPDADRLFAINLSDPSFQLPVQRMAAERFRLIAEKSTSFSGLASGNFVDLNISNGDVPRFIRGSYVNKAIFDTMGIQPVLGRAFMDGDFAPDAPSVCVLSHRAWLAHFGGNPGVLGTQFKANGMTRTVVGVLPPRFLWRRIDMYLPHNPQGADQEPVRSLNVVGRLKPGISPEQAEAELAPLLEELRNTGQPALSRNTVIRLEKFSKAYGTNLTDHLWALLAGVCLLLLTACANVSSLLLAHGLNKQKDFTIRRALGASQWSIAKAILTESLLLSFSGALIGTALAYLLVHLVRTLLPANMLPPESELKVNPLVIGLSAALAILSAVLAGLTPIVLSGRTPLASVLRESGRALTASISKRSLRTVLTVFEIALAVMLLSGSGLLLESLLRIKDFDSGYDPSRVIGFRLPLNETRYPDRTRRLAFFDRMGEDLRSIPGVKRVSFATSSHPYTDFQMAIAVPGGEVENLPVAQIRQIGTEYTALFRSKLIMGRFFTDQEFVTRSAVALINQTTERLFFGGQNAVGKLIRIPALSKPPYSNPQYNPEGVDTFTIVGVTADRTNQGIHNPIAPEVSIPSTLIGVSSVVLIETDGTEMQTLLKAAHQKILSSDPDMAISDAVSVAKSFEDIYVAGPSTVAMLTATFALSALLLAAVGLFGVVATNVASRTAEFGIRMALGADSGDIVNLVLKGGLKILLAGASIGLAGSLVSGKLLASVLYQTSPWSLTAYGITIVLLSIVGFVAAWRPARRATRVDPAMTLRES